MNKRTVAVIACIALLLSSVSPSFSLDEATISDAAMELVTANYAVENEVRDDVVADIENETTREAVDEFVEDEATVSEVEIVYDVATVSEAVVEAINLEEATISDIEKATVSDIEKATTSEIEKASISELKEDNTSFGAKPQEKKEIYKCGAIPAGFTVDILERNGVVDGSNSKYFGDSPNLPATYDSRTHTNSHGVNILPPVRNQNPYGTCWAFSSIGAIETSLRSKNIIQSESDEGADLSEAALALYTIEGLQYITNDENYIDRPGVENADYNCLNYDYYWNVRHMPRASMSFADSGGTESIAMLMASTYMGIVSEHDFPHTVDNITAINNELRNNHDLAAARKPYAFNRNRYEVLNVDFINKFDRETIKEAVMKYGGITMSYGEFRDNVNTHEDNGEFYYLSPDKACKINPDGSCGEEKELGSNHAVMIVGWDDNVPAEKFYFDGEVYQDKGSYEIASYSVIEDGDDIYYPTYSKVSSRAGQNGAWLIRNSWGTTYNLENHGYFWLSYNDFNTDDVMCAVDAVEAGEYKYNYHYDTSGSSAEYNYIGLGKLANVFHASSDVDQVLDAVNIAWKSANFDYVVDIYVKETAMNNPEDGVKMLTQTVHNGTSGIKTIKLDKSVLVKKGEYFSIIVTPKNYNVKIFVDYSYKDDNSDRFYYNEVKKGESWENDEGTWKDMYDDPHNKFVEGGKTYGASPRIKGLTDEAKIITFNAGGGTGKMREQGMKGGTTGKIDKNTFKKHGYKFLNWLGSDGNTYADNAEITLDDNITLTAQWTPAPTPVPGPSGGSSSSGGGGGAVIPYSPYGMPPTTTQVATTKASSQSVNASQVKWEYDVMNNKFKLNINALGNALSAANGFYVINGVVQDTYYFDNNGYMITGFVNTADGKTYFFENAKTMDEGKMILGWKKILDDWYYFSADGSMLANGSSPDGYVLGADGKMLK